MTTYFTSDLHLGHVTVSKLRGRDDPEQFSAEIVDAINDVVLPDDDLWVLGDLALGSIKDSLALATTINGHKHLVVGNHDRVFLPEVTNASGTVNQSKLDRWTKAYNDAGFEIHHGVVPYRLGDLDVLLSHFPYDLVDHSHEVRFPEHYPTDEGLVLLHGHLHGRWKVRGRQVDVGWDAWGEPISEADVLAVLAQTTC